MSLTAGHDDDHELLLQNMITNCHKLKKTAKANYPEQRNSKFQNVKNG